MRLNKKINHLAADRQSEFVCHDLCARPRPQGTHMKLDEKPMKLVDYSSSSSSEDEKGASESGGIQL
ncbi:hypothetical protein GOP47_0023924 [Adiantum capillus-veneris]|uniref:Uncharacterized protein n=1 Tax=Adiantum capillus-veneris TaxID=13818 RepID=A0A9D4Z4X2_ADICA|nr:hypothetical protein GOP47_0023924 [Adiantum capillus-veneris]